MVAEKKSKRVIFTPCPPRMERGTIVICIFSIFSIFVQDVHVPYYNHAAGSQASMTIGKPLALISLSRTRGSICGNTNGACRIPCPLFSSICVSTNGACRFPCHIVSTASAALSGSSARQDITALNFHSCSSAYLDFLRNALSQIVSSSTQLIISLSSTRGSICVNTKNNDQFYLDYMLLGMSLIIFIESKSNGKFYLDYLLRVSSKACFNKVQSIRHSFQHPSRTKKIRHLYDPPTYGGQHAGAVSRFNYKADTSHLQKESIKLQAAFIAVAAGAA